MHNNNGRAIFASVITMTYSGFALVCLSPAVNVALLVVEVQKLLRIFKLGMGLDPATPSTEKQADGFPHPAAALCAKTWVLPMELGGN